MIKKNNELYKLVGLKCYDTKIELGLSLYIIVIYDSIFIHFVINVYLYTIRYELNSHIPDICTDWHSFIKLTLLLFVPIGCAGGLLGTRRIGHPYQNRTPPKRKKPRTSFTRSQISQLEEKFNKHRYLSSVDRAALAKALKMTDAQVKTWFQNRRTKWR